MNIETIGGGGRLIDNAFLMPRSLSLTVLPLLLGGCLHVKMDPIEVHATVDVNVRVERALDDFFSDLDQQSTTLRREPNS